MTGHKKLVLTGDMATPDSFGKLRLCLVHRLDTTNKIDDSWYLLKNAVYSCGYRHGKQPYKLIDHGKADDLGIRGECWISVPKSRSEKILQEAKELVGKEIEVTVQLRRYSFAPKHGSLQIQGVSLSFVSGLTALKSP